MTFLKANLEEIDQAFKPDLNFLGGFPPLTKLQSELIDCWSCYEIFSYGDDGEYEKEYVDPRKFKFSKTARKTFKYDCIYKKVGATKFKEEVEAEVNVELTDYLRKVNEEFLEQNTIVKSKIYLKNFFVQIEKCIDKLTRCSPNKYQKVAIEVYFRAYLKMYDEILETYDEFFPDFLESYRSTYLKLHGVFEDNFGYLNELDQFVHRDFHDSFLENEHRLAQNSFLGKNMCWQKSKNDLVRYYLYLDDKSYFKATANKNHLVILRVLSARYNVVLGKQTNPNRIKKLIGKYDLFCFLEVS